MAVSIDTHAEIKKLTEGGTFTLEQAERLCAFVVLVAEGGMTVKRMEVPVNTINGALAQSVVTKPDLHAAVTEIKTRVLIAVLAIALLQAGLITALVLKLMH